MLLLKTHDSKHKIPMSAEIEFFSHHLVNKLHLCNKMALLDNETQLKCEI